MYVSYYYYYLLFNKVRLKGKYIFQAIEAMIVLTMNNNHNITIVYPFYKNLNLITF